MAEQHPITSFPGTLCLATTASCPLSIRDGYGHGCGCVCSLLIGVVVAVAVTLDVSGFGECAVRGRVVHARWLRHSPGRRPQSWRPSGTQPFTVTTCNVTLPFQDHYVIGHTFTVEAVTPTFAFHHCLVMHSRHTEHHSNLSTLKRLQTKWCLSVRCIQVCVRPGQRGWLLVRDSTGAKSWVPQSYVQPLFKGDDDATTVTSVEDLPSTREQIREHRREQPREQTREQSCEPRVVSPAALSPGIHPHPNPNAESKATTPAVAVHAHNPVNPVANVVNKLQQLAMSCVLVVVFACRNV